VLGVHAIGERAAEIIHIGQAVMTCEGTIEYFVNTVFNYPTLAEAYKIAAFDGMDKLYTAPWLICTTVSRGPVCEGSWRHWRASRHCADALILPTVSSLLPIVFPRGSGEVHLGFVDQVVSLVVSAQKTRVIGTGRQDPCCASKTCTETQSTNQRTVGGGPGSFWTACGRDNLAAATGGTLTLGTLATNFG
jgi:hypothetical protein